MMRRSCNMGLLAMLLSVMLAFSSAYLTPSRYTTLRGTNAIRSRSRRSFVPVKDASQFSQGGRVPMKTTTTLSYSVLDSDTNESPFKPANETETQQQFEQVLSSPELLDPALVLDATIGITQVIESAASSARVDVASLEDAVQISDLSSYEPSATSDALVEATAGEGGGEISDDTN
eukprot:scaffold8562_cov102-Skeletonema_dohrnii-CCMP3373.AAC.9